MIGLYYPQIQGSARRVQVLVSLQVIDRRIEPRFKGSRAESGELVNRSMSCMQPPAMFGLQDWTVPWNHHIELVNGG